MDPITIFASINGILALANAAIEAGKDAAPYIQALYNTFSGKDIGEITEAELAELQAKVDALHADIQEPLPPEEP